MSKPCPDCKGSKKMTINVENPFGIESPFKSGPVEIPCIRCDGTGEDIGKVFMEDLAIWCKCPRPDVGRYVPDGPCPKGVRGAKCEVTKHHYHCKVCGGVAQIG